MQVLGDDLPGPFGLVRGQQSGHEPFVNGGGGGEGAPFQVEFVSFAVGRAAWCQGIEGFGLSESHGTGCCYFFGAGKACLGGRLGAHCVVDFVWDEAKRDSNLAKHGLDLLDARQLFDGRALSTYASPRAGEMRRVSVGLLGDRMVALVWVERDGTIRFISLRRARDVERRTYRALHG